MNGGEFMDKMNALSDKKQIAIISNIAKEHNWPKFLADKEPGNFHIVTTLDSLRVGREFYNTPLKTVKRWWIQEYNSVNKISATFGEVMLRLMLNYNGVLKSPILL